jgi:hypothetical protein
MARVRDIEIDEVPEDVQPIYKQFATQYGPFLNQVRVFGHRPTAVKHIMGMLLDFKDEQVCRRGFWKSLWLWCRSLTNVAIV